MNSMASSDGSTMHTSRIRRHTMVPSNPSQPLSMPSGTSPNRRSGPYPSPPNSERTAISGGVEIKKKPRAMSEATGESSGSMMCDICGKSYKHASCLSKHRYELPFAHAPHIIYPTYHDPGLTACSCVDGSILHIGRRRQSY